MAAEAHRIALAEKPMRDCPALFVDRDGTLIEDPGYIADPDQVQLIPGIVETGLFVGMANQVLTVLDGKIVSRFPATGGRWR